MTAFGGGARIVSILTLLFAVSQIQMYGIIRNGFGFGCADAEVEKTGASATDEANLTTDAAPSPSSSATTSATASATTTTDADAAVDSPAIAGEPTDAETEKNKKVKKRKKKKTIMDCEGFPDWPLSPALALYDDRIGSPRCHSVDSSYRWVLHQTSAPNRRPSVEEVKETLSNLPTGTGYVWHTDEDICDFMRTQPLRFQALFNYLDNTAHRIDLWRYLLLHEKGGIYLDDDAYLVLKFNSSFVNSVDSVYVTQGNSPNDMGTADDNDGLSPFGFTIYNGFLISKPCNRVLLSVAERMVHIGGPRRAKELRTWENEIEHPHQVYWYNLKLLANAIAERTPEALHPDAKCEAGPWNCTFFERDTRYKVPFDKKVPFDDGEGVIVYQDDHDWTTAVFDVPQCGMAVKQVAGGKHDAVAPENPHPSPWIPAKYNRIVFTHVGKSGGSYVINVMKALQKRNGFKVVKGSTLNGFHPPKQKLIADLKSMKNNTIYENHANYVQGLEDREWISMVRDPLELMNSLFYYSVDTEIRGEKAHGELDSRKEDTVCGCFNLEFDECIDTKYKNNCTIELPPQMAYFCEPEDPNCSLDIALRHVDDYLLIGITEEMTLTLTMLEKLSPWSFGGQAEVLTTTATRSTNVFNPVTKTSLNGAISTRTRKQIRERAINYRDEIQFYNAVKRIFWRKVVEFNEARSWQKHR